MNTPLERLKHHVSGAIERGEKESVMAKIELNCTRMVGAENCKEITHIDCKGFIYCQTCGERRKASGIRCRKMTKAEIKRLESGLPLERY